MTKFLITVSIWCLYVHIRSEVKCQFDVANYSSFCGANLTTESKLYDSKRNIFVPCSLQFLNAAGLSKAENDSMIAKEDGPSYSKCELSLKMENCLWPNETFSVYFESLQRATPKVKVWKFEFSETCTGENISGRSLKRFMLDGLHDLFSLDLSGNCIETLDGAILDDLRRLREVDLSHNRIISVPVLLFQYNKHLKHISLANNKMATLAGGVFNSTTKLLFLNLSYNILEYIGSNLFAEVIPLQELHLRHNHIQTVDQNAFNKLYNLHYVDLSHNYISFPYSPPCRNGQLTPELTANYLLANMALFTKGPIVDLSHNHISGISVSPVSHTCFRGRCNKITVRLNDNPIMCECRAYDLIQYFHNKSSDIVYKIIEIDSDTSCMMPDTHVIVPLSTMNSSRIYCNISECDTCPKGCRCGFHKDTVKTIVNCNGLNFTQTPKQLRSSSEIELWLKNNLLHSLSPRIPYFFNITVLSVAYNKINDLSRVEFLKFSSLQVLEMDHNELQYLNVSTVVQLKKSNLKKITLGFNPWKCDDCRIEYLVDFLQYSKNVYDLMDVNCSGTNTPVISIKVKPCNGTWSINMELMLCAAVIILTVTPLAMYIGYKLKSKLFITLSPVNNVEMDEKEYDAFISYSHEDEYYVCELTRQLEQPPDPLKICLHSRNWLPGELIIKQIVDSIKRSRTTVIVLSIAYIQSEWCSAEFQIALTHMLMRKNHKVIVIWCSEENPADMDLETEFKTYLKMCTYLKRDDENFLKRLELAIERL